MIDLLLHYVPWAGDKIRLYDRTFKVGDSGRMIIEKDVLRGEFTVTIQSGEVYVLNHGYIRRDLPKWNTMFGCWEYFYTDDGG